MPTRSPTRLTLAAIIVVYLVIATLYATLTPRWQNPDEPAHYNYVRSLAEGRGFPVLEMGDYDQALLARLTTERFPPQIPITPLEYEDHQPPLYYLLATPVYRLTGGAVLPLRLISVVLGAGLLVAIFGAVRTLFPAQPRVALSAAALVAFIPQHVAMTASVNNDTLGELILAVTLWMLVVYVHGGERDMPWIPGVFLGIALVTKTTAYIVLGVAAIAVALRWSRERRPLRWALGQLGWMFIPALLVAAPWFLRNVGTYGWRDPLGLARHDAVVVGQPRSVEWLTRYGWGGLIARMARTTFQSFWGQFGWMGVVLPRRLYLGLALFSAALLAGFVGWWLNARPQPLPPRRRDGLLLLAASLTLTVLAFLWYNLTFIQHQGRYLFPALLPLGAVMALGLERWLDLLPEPARDWAWRALFAALALFDVYCLYRFILPALTR
jgi:4-amino-4-deoxy-L-arabinose transferase-like glycosyltransferase